MFFARFVLMDLTDPAGPAMALYTADFYRDVNRVLNPAGALALHIGSPFFHGQAFAGHLRSLEEVFAVVRPYFVHIPLYGANWGMACASQSTDPTKVSPGTVDDRIRKRGISHLNYYNGDMHQAGFALPNYVRELIGRNVANSGKA